jgi:hypothetical protein
MNTCRVAASQGLWRLGFVLALAAIFPMILPCESRAQVDYVARFTMDKQKFIQGEPVFCNFVIQNTGARTFSFRYRFPDRVLNRNLEGEPGFSARKEDGRALPDPAPSACGGAKGTVVYGSVTLPPGQVHTERWLLNQWARFSIGRYHLQAQRRLPLRTVDPATPEFLTSPAAAYALALNEFSLEIAPFSENELRAAFAPYLKVLEAPPSADPAEAVLVLTALPQFFFLDKLVALAYAPVSEHRWNRNRALEGLARLGTRPAWDAIIKIARGEDFSGSPPRGKAVVPDDSLRAYAILLLGERADPAFFPVLSQVIASASPDLRGEALHALGFFHDARANNVLFEKLHSENSTDRVNAILGLRNLNRKESIPALLAMLHDPSSEVRQVANFALQGLTTQTIRLSPSAGPAESERVAAQWHQWWQDHAESFVPARQIPCHDW